MKVLLTAINSKFIHSNLAVRYLKAYTKDLDYECKIKEFTINDRKERILEKIIMERPDIVAFSCYIWNIGYVEALTELIKLINPDIKILLGGPEVSYDSKVVMEKLPVDFIIEGEGEAAYRELIINLIKSNNINNIKSIFYRKDGNVVYGGKRELLDMEKLVFPYKSDENFDNKIVYYEASRGCPYSCKYCLSSTTHGVRFLDLERVKKELQFFIDKKVNLVKFVDRTFNCNNKYAAEIWKFLIDADTETTFHFEISADILSDEQINLLKAAPKGRFQFEVGVQTTNEEILKNIDRYAPYEEIKKRVTQIKGCRNIKQHMDLIAGLPGENLYSFINSFNELYDSKPEEIQLGFLKLLKGSSMRAEAAKWGITYSPFPPYEVLKTDSLSYEELINLKHIEEMVDKYYNSQKFSTIIKYFETRFSSPYVMFHSFAQYFYEIGFGERNISGPEYYKFFVLFSENKLKEESEVLKEIVKFDYLKYNKKKWIPDFLNRYIDNKLEKCLRAYFMKDRKEEIHIEKFKIDILKFAEEGVIIKKDSYLLFNDDIYSFDNHNIKDITSLADNFINKEGVNLKL